MVARNSRRGRALSSVVVCVLLTGVGAGVTASAAPGRATGAAAGRASADPGSLIPPTNESVTGIGLNVGLGTSARVGRAKINIAVRDQLAFTYPFAGTDLGGRLYDSYRRVPDAQLPARPDPACTYAAAGYVVPLWAVQIDAARQRFRSVGHVADSRVSFPAFGSLPVTAMVRIRQLIRGGKAEPLVLFNPSIGVFSVRKDDPNGLKGTRGCDPRWERDASPLTTVDGRVEASVSDVRVDGRPVDVGDDCRTTTPIRLHLLGTDEAHGGTGYDVLGGGVLRQTLDRRRSSNGSRLALLPGSSNLVIPAFRGCRGATGEDVSALVSGLVSGSNNTLAVVQANPLFESNTTQRPFLCGPSGECPRIPAPVAPPVPGR